VDTVLDSQHGQLHLQSVWGSSNKDVYAVGWGSAFTTIWHYDGSSWNNLNLASGHGGPIIGAFVLEAITGLGANDIWAVGAIWKTGSPSDILESFSVHKDKNGWHSVPMDSGGMMKCIAAVSSNDIWAGGLSGTLQHYEGTKWKRVSLNGDSAHIGSIAVISSNEVYLEAYGVVNLQAYQKLLKWNGESVSTIDSFTISGPSSYRFGYNITAIDGVMYSTGFGVWKWNGLAWTKIVNDIEEIVSMTKVTTGEFLLVGPTGKVFAYDNGSVTALKTPGGSNCILRSSWADSKGVFVVGFDFDQDWKSVILRGQ